MIKANLQLLPTKKEWVVQETVVTVSRKDLV